MKTLTVLCGVTLLACAAAANVERLDDRADQTVAAAVDASAETDALLANVDCLAAGTMTPAERLAWQQELRRKASAAQASMQQLRASHGVASETAAH